MHAFNAFLSVGLLLGKTIAGRLHFQCFFLYIIGNNSLNQWHVTLNAWWLEINGSLTCLSTDVLNYLENKFAAKPDGGSLWIDFGCDGITTIPAMFPNTPRIESLRMIRKMFDYYLKSKFMVKELANHSITSDDKHIIQYIGGYMLQRLMRKASGERLNCLQTLLGQHKELCNNSLIAALNNPKLGTLTVPSNSLLKFLVYLESSFRRHFAVEKIICGIMSNINTSYVCHLFPTITKDQQLNKIIFKICNYYLKIRCHHKANKLSTSYGAKSDQNISFRKSLKLKKNSLKIIATDHVQ